MRLLNTKSKPTVTVRFSSVFFGSLPEQHEKAWVKKFGVQYPAESDLRRIARTLDTFAISDGAAFARFVESELKVRGVEATHVFYVCPWISGSISEPGILNPSRSPKLMQMTVLHELAHGLLTRNNLYDIDDSPRGSLSDAWRSRWGGEIAFNTLIHIPVFALLEQYVTRHRPTLRALLDEDRRRHAQFPAYAEAWEFVDQKGSSTICGDVRECMAGLGTQK